MTPKQIKTKREKEQKRKLEEIRANAFARGQRMAARQIAERKGFMAGINSVKNKKYWYQYWARLLFSEDEGFGLHNLEDISCICPLNT